MARRNGPNGYDFAAIDFETANYARDSACAVGITIVQAGRITTRESRLIRPARTGIPVYAHSRAYVGRRTRCPHVR